MLDAVWMGTSAAGLSRFVAYGLGDGSFGEIAGGFVSTKSYSITGKYELLAQDVNLDGADDLIWMNNSETGLRQYVSFGQSQDDGVAETFAFNIGDGDDTLVGFEDNETDISQVTLCCAELARFGGRFQL